MTLTIEELRTGMFVNGSMQVLERERIGELWRVTTPRQHLWYWPGQQVEAKEKRSQSMHKKTGFTVTTPFKKD